MNLNISVEKRKTPPERFNPKRPQGNAPSFRPTFSTFAYSLFACLILLSIGGFGLYGVANGGKFPNIHELFGEEKKQLPPGVPPGPPEVKTTEEEVKEVLSEYASTWNNGWENGIRPKEIFSPDFSAVVDHVKAQGDDIAEEYDPRTKIAGMRLDSLALLSDSKALADGTFHLQRTRTFDDWDKNSKLQNAASMNIVIDRFVRYSFELQKGNNKWLVVRQTWLEKAPARIKAAEDTTAEEIPLPETDTLFKDLRPNKEQLQIRYDSMASGMSSGSWPNGECYPEFKLILADGTERTLDQAQKRLINLRNKVDTMEFKATVDGVSQIGESSAVALVTYRVNLLTKLASKNIYTMTWQDRDTWLRSVSGSWYLNETERQGRSSIGAYYGY